LVFDGGDGSLSSPVNFISGDVGQGDNFVGLFLFNVEVLIDGLEFFGGQISELIDLFFVGSVGVFLMGFDQKDVIVINS
jgi:hypothetical protein